MAFFVHSFGRYAKTDNYLCISDGVLRPILTSLGLEGYRSRSQANCFQTSNIATTFFQIHLALENLVNL